MANYQQAPTLKFNGKKQAGQFYQIPQELADIIFTKLGNSSAQLRIMIVLLGTKEGFKISDKWICERTGLQHPSYITARKALVKRGWLTHEPAEGITVNIAAIYAECSNTILPQEEIKQECSNTTLPQGGNTTLLQRGNTTLPQCSNTILPITYNTDNNKDKITDSVELLPGAVIPKQPPEEIAGQKPLLLTRKEAIGRYGATTCANSIATGKPNCYWIGGELVKLV